MAQYDFAPDVARAAVTAAHGPGGRAAVYNVPGVLAELQVVASIQHGLCPVRMTWGGDALPFPPALEATGYDLEVGTFPRTSLADGVAATVLPLPLPEGAP